MHECSMCTAIRGLNQIEFGLNLHPIWPNQMKHILTHHRLKGLIGLGLQWVVIGLVGAVDLKNKENFRRDNGGKPVRFR